MANEFEGRALDWDDEIEQDGSFTLLEAGDYNFTVLSFERGSFPGSTKLPPCNKAVLTIRVFDNDGHESTWKEDFIMHTKVEFKLSEIHRALGLKKHGEKLHMQWKKMVGLSGCCKVKVDVWTGKNGNEMKSNKVEKYYDPGTLGVSIAAPTAKQGNMFAPKP